MLIKIHDCVYVNFLWANGTLIFPKIHCWDTIIYQIMCVNYIPEFMKTTLWKIYDTNLHQYSAKHVNYQLKIIQIATINFNMSNICMCWININLLVHVLKYVWRNLNVQSLIFIFLTKDFCWMHFSFMLAMESQEEFI